MTGIPLCAAAVLIGLACMRFVSSSTNFAAGQDITGTWEGEIEEAQRPTVVDVDFTAGTVSLSGATPTPMTHAGTVPDDSVRFGLTIGTDTLRFAGARVDTRVGTRSDATVDMRSDATVDMRSGATVDMRSGARVAAPGDTLSGTRVDTRIEGMVTVGANRAPFWIERLPARTAPVNRAESWRQDLDVVLTRFLRYDRSFSKSERAAARRRIEELQASADRLTDQQMAVELERAVALSGNAHTRLYQVRNRTNVRMLPIRVWWFRDELRIVRTASGHEDLLGCRITRIGNLDIKAAFRRVRNLDAGNESWQRYMSAYFITSSDILYGTGVIDDPEHVQLTVECGRDTRGIELDPLPLYRSSKPVEAWWDISPSHPEAGFTSALPAERAPLYLRHGDRNYWCERIEEPPAVYVQFNRAQAMPDEPMSAFVERVSRLLEEEPVKGLIIDVRFNTGGDAGVGTPLVETLTPKLGGVPVFVLTSRTTFSAGITHAAQWKQLAHAAVIGEPVGDALDMWAEGGNIELPNSGLIVHYANGFHTYSPREYPEYQPYFMDLNVESLQPDVVVEPSWADYIAGKDPLLAAVAARLQARTR